MSTTSINKFKSPIKLSQRTTTSLETDVKEGSEIYIDQWREYSWIGKEGFGVHRTVNHTKNFVDPNTGARTQKIESNWRPLKNRGTRGGIHRKDLYLDLWLT